MIDIDKIASHAEAILSEIKDSTVPPAEEPPVVTVPPAEEPPVVTVPPVTAPPIVGGAVAKSVSDILDMTKPGATVYVRRGNLGSLVFNGISAAGATIIPEDPSDPSNFSDVSVLKSSGFCFSGFSVVPSIGAKMASVQKYLVKTDAASARITFKDLDIKARDDADDFTNWTKADWTAWAWSGIQFLGRQNLAQGCKMTGVNFGFSTLADEAYVAGNIVFGFTGDAYRINGNNCVVVKNRGTDSHTVNSNHCDLFQSFKKLPNGTYQAMVGNLYEDNVGIEWTVRRNNPLREKLQGFGMYNGLMDGIIMRRNHVETTSYTGVTINSGKNCIIEDNYFGNVDKVVADCGRFKVAGTGNQVHRNQAPKFIGTYDSTNVKKPF
jgi:hypothetical protein